MYKIRRTSFKEFKKTCLISTEPGEPQNAEDFEFFKLTYDNNIICIVGHKLEQDESKVYLIGSFLEYAKKHVRALVELGRWYIKTVSVAPVEILVEDNNKCFERFAEFFGFKKTLAQECINSVTYNVYIRNPECLLQQ